MRLKKLHHLLIGIALGIVVIVPIGVFAFVKSGIYSVAASQRHTKFTQWITHDTMINSVDVRARGLNPPAWTSADQLVAGFCAYETHCVACHGASAVARQQWVSGMEPQPPYLLDVTRRFTPSQLFWIAKNGIKMTGMPGWGDSMSDRKIWNVVAWLEASEKLPPQTFVQWRSERRCASIGQPTPSPGPLAIHPSSPEPPTGATGE
ncbi:MAG TPA: cytochrome c [Sphingomicrobium sp.]|nr:cytochrome c [Sphingomicrobium sp.]